MLTFNLFTKNFYNENTFSHGTNLYFIHKFRYCFSMEEIRDCGNSNFSYISLNTTGWDVSAMFWP